MRHPAKKLRAFRTSQSATVSPPATPLLFEHPQPQSDVRYVLKKAEAWGWLMILTMRALIGALCVLMSAYLCPAQSAAQQATSNVEGRVLHEPGGEPIRKVVVRLLPTNLDSRVYTSFAGEGGMNEADAIEVFSSLSGSEALEERLKYVAATDAEGRFKIEKVPPGAYIVSLLRAGYVPAGAKPRGMMITVVEGQNLTDQTYKMVTAGLIAGKIVDADGDPMSGLMVQVMPKGQGDSAFGGILANYVVGMTGILPGTGMTNDLGEYRIAGLRAGQYLLIARPRGNVAPPPAPASKVRKGERLLYAPTYFPGVLEEKQASVLQVVSGGTATADFTMLAHHAYRVSGIVSGSSGGEGSFITLMSNTGRPQQQPLGEGGKFEFRSLEPGTYFARVDEMFGGPPQQKGPKMMTVPTPIVVSGSDLIDLVLQPLANGKVSGKFRAAGSDNVDWKQMTVSLMSVAEQGEPLADKGVFNLLQRGGSGTVNEDGTFEIEDVAPGNYQVAVFSPSEKYRDWYLKSLLFAGREVADTGFAASGETSLDVVVSAKGASIEGKVVDGAGKPAAGVLVLTLPSSGKLGRPDSYQTAKTDANGSFLMRGLNPGEFVVLALENLRGDARSADFYQKYSGQGMTVSLTEGEKKAVALTLAPDETK